MQISQHKNAKTTLAIRKEIQESSDSIADLAKRFSLSPRTVKKWRSRNFTTDVSSRPHKLQTKLSESEEWRICFERKQFKKSMYDITDTLLPELPSVNDMQVYRCLRRNGLEKLPPEFLAEERKIKKFRKYAIGYLHIDFLYAPKIAGSKSYIFTAIDRVSKIAFLWVYPTYSIESGVDFLKKVLAFYPYNIHYLLTDNGNTFNYNALIEKRRPKDREHPFVALCKENHIDYRTTKPYHPWTNGMVENFNKRVRHNVLDKVMFDTIQAMGEKLREFVDVYNHDTKLRKLNRQSPAQYLEKEKNLKVQRIVTLQLIH